MKRSGPRLPPVVTLPDAEVISASHLRDALGVSKAVLWWWRREQGFPFAYREGRDRWTITACVEQWLRERGVEVRQV